eukprot:TRINITY_DN65943_c3_g1_i1.p1 TRINITY_DN65943_c3_g1~~TRINITY_DN65943_c3_g1_i1.p1  ORF type:complete len:401 (+),score=93.39 TRINITY_DN65943_c3_g1_i1:99-1301(+)
MSMDEDDDLFDFYFPSSKRFASDTGDLNRPFADDFLSLENDMNPLSTDIPAGTFPFFDQMTIDPPSDSLSGLKRSTTCPNFADMIEPVDMGMSRTSSMLISTGNTVQNTSSVALGGSSGLKSVSSCPNFDVLNHDMDEETKKKIQRLARNRASARLRRQRKRNQTQSLEREAQMHGKLLELLNKMDLEGKDETVEFLEEKQVPCMTTVTKERRVDDVKFYFNEIQNVVQELQVCSGDHLSLALLGYNGSDTEALQLRDELQEALDLSPEQSDEVAELSKKIQMETQRLAVLMKCTQVMEQCSGAHLGVLDQVEDPVRSVLHIPQLEHLAKWTTHNEEALSTLRYCNGQDWAHNFNNSASSALAPPQWTNNPTFFFGVEGKDELVSGFGETGSRITGNNDL